ncbi:dihydrolipoamide acetyltransferase family protein [Micromonospora sp. NPDC047738]|uniref:dihydrolipoamide acetyltransferase family protein n=1 Tax=Micromonospora sp. NPDC047738 TaxID=3155741 RepID=UPI0033EF31E7
MIDILMPRLSDTMEEGAIATWHKKPGEKVEVGDILVEIETDKAIMEYEAYEAGTLHDILVPAGERAAIGTVIGRLDDGLGHPSSPPEEPATETTPAPTAPPNLPADTTRQPAAPGAQALPPQSETQPRVPHKRLFATPLVRRLARENAIDLDEITGSGPGGRIVRADIQEALTAREQRPADSPQATAAEPAEPGDSRHSTAIPFDSTRQVISRRLTESSNSAPHFYVTAVADVEELLQLRATINSHLDDLGRGTVSVNDLIVRAGALALRQHPGLNASYSPEGRGQTLIHERVNIGIAVSSPTGLVVPVIHDADQKTLSQIAADSQRLSHAARDRKLTGPDMAHGTFTISNLGMYGVEQFTAIINPPEGAILAVGAALPEPVAAGDTVAIHRRIRYTLSADHRIIDGALAAQFLTTLTNLLERPMALLA